MEFTRDIEACLDALGHGRLIGFSTPAGWMLGGVATLESTAAELLDKAGGKNLQAVILLADERDYLQFISALDLAVFDQVHEMTMPAAARFDGVLGIAENLLQPDGSALFSLVEDPFTIHLIKRFRQPIAVLPVEKEQLNNVATYVAGHQCKIEQPGFSIFNFV